MINDVNLILLLTYLINMRILMKDESIQLVCTINKIITLSEDRGCYSGWGEGSLSGLLDHIWYIHSHSRVNYNLIKILMDQSMVLIVFSYFLFSNQSPDIYAHLYVHTYLSEYTHITSSMRTFEKLSRYINTTPMSTSKRLIRQILRLTNDEFTLGTSLSTGMSIYAWKNIRKYEPACRAKDSNLDEQIPP
jgi:hypothetical protein